MAVMPMDLSRYAAYHGGSFKKREREKLSTTWPFVGADSEYAKIREVILYRAPKSPPPIRDPEKAQHLRSLAWRSLSREVARLARSLEKNGVRVLRLEADWFADFKPNLMFARDLFFMTPWGAVLSRMGSPVRAGEEKWAQLALAKAGVPVALMIRGGGTFEGADALWINPKLVCVGVGNRTNREGFNQLKKFLAEFGVKTVAVKLPQKVQHLLGLLQIVGPKLALVRTQIAPKLPLEGFRIVPVGESAEVVHKQAMNILTLRAGRVLMPSGCPEFKALLLRHKIKVADELPISQLLNAAGGIACAVAPLGRSLMGS